MGIKELLEEAEAPLKAREDTFLYRIERKPTKTLKRYEKILRPHGFLDSIHYYLSVERNWVRHHTVEQLLLVRESMEAVSKMLNPSE